MRTTGLLLLLVVCLACTACSGGQTDAVFIAPAAFLEQAVERPDTAEMTGRAFREARFFSTRGHRIGAGSGMVMAYRWYSPGRIFIIDDEEFEKVTIELLDTLWTAPQRLTLGVGAPVTVRYTKGSASWPITACYGTASSGVVEILARRPRRIQVSVVAEIEPVKMMGRPCESVRFERKITFRRLPEEELTPWLGTPGDISSDETYR